MYSPTPEGERERDRKREKGKKMARCPGFKLGHSLMFDLGQIM
jgi:hypothetical protein